MLFAATLACVLLVAYLFVWYRNTQNLPPGPWGVPILGYLPFMSSNNMYVNVRNLKTSYGAICSVQLGVKTVIFINDHLLIKQLLIEDGDKYASRPGKMYSFNDKNDRKGIVPNDGEDWKSIRRLSMTILRDFGMGRLAVETKVKRECSYLMSHLEDHGRNPLALQNLLMNSVSNIICSIVFGDRYEYSDPDFKNLMGLVVKTFEMAAGSSILNWLPYLQTIPPLCRRVEEDWKTAQGLWDFVIPKIAAHKKRIEDVNHVPQDFLDAYLKEVQNCMKTNIPRAQLLESSLLYTVTQLFLAGTETTSTTLEWGMLFMVLYPVVQRRVQKQLDDVIGRDRMPSYDDHSKLPYVEACIREIHRMAMLGPVLLPHSNENEQWIAGYRIPERSIILMSTSLPSMDPSIFEDPLQFQPERFISPDGTVDNNKLSYIPYSGGKRACAGETLARMEVFLFFTSILHKFTILGVDGKTYKYPSLEERKQGLTCRPPNFEIIAQKRLI